MCSVVYFNQHKKSLLVIFITLIYFDISGSSSINLSNSAMTFKANAGRFGDQIVNYIKSKWLAYKYNIPFYFIPFPQSYLISAHVQEPRLAENTDKYQTKVLLKSESDLLDNPEQTLFVTDARTRIILNNERESHSFRDYSHDLFLKIIEHDDLFQDIKKMLQPIVPIKKIDLPLNSINIAVHIRKGSGSDSPLHSLQQFSGHENLVDLTHYHITKFGVSDHQAPKKFPPEQFYIDQIKWLAKIFENQKLFVYIFTDDPEPETLQMRIDKRVGIATIRYASSKNFESYLDTLIDDYYNMASFDYLIRPDSSLSYCSQLLGNHKIVIFPENALWVDNKLIINKVGIIIR